MTKLEIEMQNNELEARVIELEAELAGLHDEMTTAEAAAQVELDDAENKFADLQAENEELQAQVDAMTLDLKPEHFDSWYKRLHPVAGGDPDLRVAAQPVRIIA